MPSRRAPALFFGSAILLSAFLLFQVEPLIAKLILPWFGGSAAVWTACLLFFQLTLFGGYAYAHWLSRRPRGGAADRSSHTTRAERGLAADPAFTGVEFK